MTVEKVMSEREVVKIEKVEEYVLRMTREEAEVFFAITQFIGGSPINSDRGIVNKWIAGLDRVGIRSETLAEHRTTTRYDSAVKHIDSKYLYGSVSFSDRKDA